MVKLSAVLRRRWPLLVGLFVVGVVVGALSAAIGGGSGEGPQPYQAQQVVIGRPDRAGTLVSQDELKVTRGAVPQRAAEILGQPQDADALAAQITTEFDEENGSITISTTDTDAAEAQKRVQAFVTAFLEVANASSSVNERLQLEQVRQTLAAAEAELATFDRDHPNLADLPADDPTKVNLLAQRLELATTVNTIEQDIRQRETALAVAAPYDSLGQEPVTPVAGGLVTVPSSIPVRGALMGFLGLLLGGVIILILERIVPYVDSRDDLAEVTDLPILAEIGLLPPSKRSHRDNGTLLLDGTWAEPYRRVRSAIKFVQTPTNGSADAAGHPPEQPRVFLVTSTSPGEGKSTTSTLVATALAELGDRTVVIGGDFRRPGVEKLLGDTHTPTLADLARLDVDRPSIGDAIHPTETDHLYVAPAGPPTRSVAARVEVARQVCQVVRQGATVIVDSSPLQAANDTVDMLPAVDYVILVVRAGRAKAARLAESIELLERMDARILGLVLIGTPTVGREQYYYYDYYSPQSRVTT